MKKGLPSAIGDIFCGPAKVSEREIFKRETPGEGGGVAKIIYNLYR